MMSSKVIKLKSSEGDIIATTLPCALMAHTIKEMLENIGEDFDESAEVPIANVDTKILRKVVDWMEHWAEKPQPNAEEIKDKLSDTIDAWDEEYLKIELQDLYDLVRASKSLDFLIYQNIS